MAGKSARGLIVLALAMVSLALLLAATVVVSTARSDMSGAELHVKQVAGPANKTIRRDSPLVIEQCGIRWTYEAIPQRVVSSDLNITTMLMFLGVADRLVGYSGVSPSEAARPRVVSLLKEVPRISSSYNLNLETILGVHADFVVSGWRYGLSKGGVTPQLLANYGIGTYVISTSTSCIQGHGITLYDPLKNLRQLARIFGVKEKVSQRIEKLEKKVDLLKKKTNQVDRRPRVFVYGSGVKMPSTSGRFAMPNAMIRAAGGRNIFAGLDVGWTSVGWEAVIKRNPEWIVIVDYGSVGVQRKINHLLNMEVLAHVSAIRHRRFLVISYTESTPSPFNVYQAQRFAAAFHPELNINPDNPMKLFPHWNGSSS